MVLSRATRNTRFVIASARSSGGMPATGEYTNRMGRPSIATETPDSSVTVELSPNAFDASDDCPAECKHKARTIGRGDNLVSSFTTGTFGRSVWTYVRGRLTSAGTVSFYSGLSSEPIAVKVTEAMGADP